VNPCTRVFGGVALALSLTVSTVHTQNGFINTQNARENYKDDDDSSRTLAIATATVSADQSTLFVTGVNFGTRPLVILANIVLGGVQVAATGGQLTALMPTLPPGSYRLVISRGSGSNRSDGMDVTVGAVGPKGEVGAVGPKGDTGDIGATGPEGPAGPQGAKGDHGDVGETGPMGPQGLRGEPGPEGPIGPQGAIGPQGPQGAIGSIGIAGARGVPGLPGATGPAGPSGIAGLTLIAGSVATTIPPTIGIDFAFVGRTTTVTLSATQRITASGTAMFGHREPGSPTLDFTMCWQQGAGPVFQMTPGFYLTAVMPADTAARLPYAVSASTTAPLLNGAGAYTVGYCVRTTQTLNNNDFVSAWVMVTNQ
jgi:hypothetical protein